MMKETMEKFADITLGITSYLSDPWNNEMQRFFAFFFDGSFCCSGVLFC